MNSKMIAHRPTSDNHLYGATGRTTVCEIIMLRLFNPHLEFVEKWHKRISKDYLNQKLLVDGQMLQPHGGASLFTKMTEPEEKDLEDIRNFIDAQKQYKQFYAQVKAGISKLLSNTTTLHQFIQLLPEQLEEYLPSDSQTYVHSILQHEKELFNTPEFKNLNIDPELTEQQIKDFKRLNTVAYDNISRYIVYRMIIE